jgi:hypothetical protein
LVLWLDTSAPDHSPITASGIVYSFGGIETEFWISVASYILQGQTGGPSAEFKIGGNHGTERFQVDYATAMAPRKMTGTQITVDVPTGAGINPISLRVVIADLPIPVGLNTQSDANGNPIPKVAGNQTIYETEGGNALEVNAQGGETVDGVNVIPAGALVNWTLGGQSPAFVAGVASTISLVGYSTGTFYATVMCPGNGSGSFYMPVAEKLDVVADNGTASNCLYAYAWQATSP